MICSFITFVTSMCATVDYKKNETFDKIENAEFYFIVVSFALFLVAYVAVFYLLTSRLKRFFPSFFAKERSQLYLAATSIIVSIAARILFVILYEIDSLSQDFDESYRENTWLWPVMQFLTVMVASLMPIASIIYSLMYAITHKKRMIKKALRDLEGKIQQTSNFESFKSLIIDENTPYTSNKHRDLFDLVSDYTDENVGRPKYILFTNSRVHRANSELSSS